LGGAGVPGISFLPGAASRLACLAAGLVVGGVSDGLGAGCVGFAGPGVVAVLLRGDLGRGVIPVQRAGLGCLARDGVSGGLVGGAVAGLVVLAVLACVGLGCGGRLGEGPGVRDAGLAAPDPGSGAGRLQCGKGIAGGGPAACAPIRLTDRLEPTS
jgi:hypothetical protein